MESTKMSEMAYCGEIANEYDKDERVMHGCVAPMPDEFEQFYGCSWVR